MSAHKMITEERDGVIGRLTFSHPNKLNAFYNKIMQAATDEFATDDDVHVVTFSDAGHAFSAGLNFQASGKRKLDSIDKVRAQMSMQFNFTIKFWDNPKLTNAAVHAF